MSTADDAAQTEMDGMTAAFSTALKKLGLKDSTDPIAELVGRKIVRAALAGERDPTALCERAMEGEATARQSRPSGRDRRKT